MKIFANLFFAVFLAFIVFYSDEAKANACLVASEEGGSEYCDDGSPQTGLPIHSATTTSKAGTTGLCNNVNVFADEKQAQDYAKSHEYDYIEKSTGAQCWTPKCTHTSETACSSGNKTCCKSLINDTCWHECNICKFNRINGDYYPYTNRDVGENCKIIGQYNMSSAYVTYFKNYTRNYKINELTNIIAYENLSEDDIWICDDDIKKTIIDDCYAAVQMVNGFGLTTNASKICLNGSAIDLSSELENYCPLSAMVCNNSKHYYNTAEECEQVDVYHSKHCQATRTFNDYADDECWHSVKQCSDLGSYRYITGEFNSLDCGDELNTTKQYYCPRDTQSCNESSAISLGGEKCGACECNSGFSRIDDCNNEIYDIISGYYNATERCDEAGYKTIRSIGSNCTACPYNAKYWKCN